MAEMLCAIPARGGSKRLLRKNLRMLAGKPLIAYTIEAACQSGLFSDLYVCTDDEEIAAVARSCGAQVPFLSPPELCDDLAPSHAPCRHLAAYLAERGTRSEALVCLQPSSPLRSAQDIKAAIAKFSEGDSNFTVSITPVDPHDFHWAVVPGEDGYWKMFFGTQYMKERPLLPMVYRPNGAVKIARLEELARVGNFFGERLTVVEMPAERSVHVATEFDLRLCETLLQEQKR